MAIRTVLKTVAPTGLWVRVPLSPLNMKDIPATFKALAAAHCSRERGTSLLSQEQTEKYLKLVNKWQIHAGALFTLWTEVELKNFTEMLMLVNKIGALAEKEQHHPNLYMHSYKFLRIELNTHEAHGLTVNDFILAAQINKLLA